MLNIFKKFLRDGLQGNRTARRSQRRRSQTGKQTTESLETRSLLTASLVNFLTTEHVDINLQRTGGQWALGPRDSDSSPAIQYANDQAVLYAGSPSVLARPSSSQFDFIGVNAGQNFYMLPASQDPNLLYLGFAAYGLDNTVDRYNPATESKGRATGSGRFAKATLTDVRHTNPNGTTGSGKFSLWQNDSFGNARVFMSSHNDGVSNANGSGLDVTDGISADDALWIISSGHSHYNFGFTQPGRYEVDLKLSAYFGDDGATNTATPNLAGFSESTPITIYFSVMSTGELQFDASSYSVNESAGTASINVVRVGGSDGRLAVNYATSNGTATAGSDYTTTTGLLEFLDGETSRTITIPILHDTDDEPNETINLTLSSPQPANLNEYRTDLESDANGLLGSITTAVLTILDDDEPANTAPTISDVVNQTTDEDTTTSAIAFTVGDAQTAAGALVVTASSSNAALVPNANIVLGGSGADRTVTITPSANQFGSTTITLTATDAGGLTATDTFLLTVNAVNDSPTISDVSNQSTDEDTATGAIPFTVGDVETAAGALVVTASSSNTALVPNANIVLGGSGANRTVTITPSANLTGTTTITLTVTDEGGLTASDTFVLTVGGINDPPTISDVVNQSTDEDTPTAAIAFTVDDLETAAGLLTVTATSSNTTLVPNASIVLGGSGANRTATITPALNQFGSTTITLTVTDAGGLIATDTFVLNVASVNDLPTISDIGNQTTPAGTSVGPINFTIGDVETTTASLTVSAASSNTTLLPLSGIVIAGNGANRTVTLSPIVGQTGTATLTLTVTDAHRGSSIETFDLVVTNNAPPTISDIANRFVVEGSSTGSIAFTVGDTETAAGDLVVAATSSNQSVIPNGNIVLGGSGANRTLTINSVPNQVGPITITVTVTDAGGLQTSDAFILTVTADSLVPFAVPASFSISKEDGASSLASADFNGDGKIDVVSVGSFPGSLVLLKGNGDGTFQAGVPVDGGSPYFARTPFAVDYDGDGDVDLLTREFDAPPAGIETEGQVAVHLNDGAGNFTRQVLVGGLTLGASAIQVGELNGDGRPDFIRWANSTTLVYHESLPGGGYAPPEVVSSSFTNLNATRFQLEDIDADGDLDILAYDTTPRRLSIFSNDGAGNFGAPQQLTFAASTTVRAVADITGDGRPDILATDTATVYYAQNSDGTFGARTVLSTIGSGVTRMIPTDLNQDGLIDLVFIQSNAPRWAAGRGNGTFGTTQVLWATTGVQAIIAPDLDADGDLDIVVGTSTTNTAVTVLENLTGENPMRLIPPAARTYLGGDQINLQVHFGFPIAVTGTPRLALQLGANTVYANYVSGSGTPTLTFRYTVGATDVDLDGLQLASNTIDLNGGTLTNPEGAPAVLAFPGALTGVIVNAPGPLVQMVSRLDAAATSAGTVRFSVQFAEDVTGVDVTDFAPRTTEGNLAGAVVQSVTGSGSLYEVTVSTGTGSGTLGLTVLGSASILDLNGDAFSMEYAGGQVYTVRQQPIGTINTYYTDGHADYRPVYNNGDFDHVWHGDPGLLPQNEYSSNELITYLDSTALVTRPAGGNFDFLGVNEGEQLYLSNASGSVASVPFMGISGEGLKANVFADYRPADDTRITSSTLQEYVKVQLVGMRSSSDGEFSLYSVSSGNPTVWMATTDGIVGTDNIWTYPGTHAHYNTAFSKPGTYEIDVVISGYLDLNANNQLDAADVYVESGIKTMVFHVDALGARNDAFEVSGKDMLRGSVTLNDEWNDGLGAYTASVQTTTTKGTLLLHPNGSFTYQPSATFDNSDSFTYRLTNPRGGFTTATVTITGSIRPDFDAVLKAGHTDIGINFEADAWDLHIHDEETDTEYEPDEAMLYVGRDAMLTRSGDAADSAYDFLGVPAGGSLFVLPQTENPDLLFLGVGAEELADGVLAGDTATLRLASVSGPGQFSIWQSGLTPTTPQLIMATSDGIDASDAYKVTAGSHAHMNFAFTKQGFYEVTFVATGVDADGNATDSGQVTYYFFVTDGLVPFALPRVVGGGLAGVSNINVVDLDADGNLDVLAGAYGANKIVWYKGNGDATFGTEQVIDAAAPETWFNTHSDLDGDGDVDVLAGMYSGTLAWYANNGSGSFIKNILATDIVGPYVRIGDLNGDGRNDILAGPDGGTTIFYFQQLSTGGFASREVLASSFSKLGGIHLNDFDSDGDLDLFAGDYGSNQLSWFVNNGSGVFGARQFISSQDSSGLDRVVDLTGDGRVDLLSLEYATGKVSYYPQTPGGGFGGRVAIPLTVADSYALAVADFDNDGDKDIADGAYGSAGMIAWVANQGNGTFMPQLQVSTGEGQVSSMTTADLDSDGDADLVVGSFSGGRVSVFENRLNEFATEVVQPASGTYLSGQKLDAAVHFGYPVTVTGTPSIALQIGSQTVQATYRSGSGTPTLTFQYTVQGSDIDSDGVQLAASLISLNGGSIIDPMGQPANLSLPTTDFTGVLVNGNAPFANAITRAGAAHGARTAQVTFLVSFNEAVQDVDASDFDLVTTGTLTGTSVVSVSGMGTTRIVVVNTGIGSGVLGLHVKPNATLTDLSGNAIGRGYAGGEVYTIQRSQSFVIDNFYTAGHGDVQAAFEDNWLELKVTPDGFEYENDEVLIYGNADALTTRPAGARWDFLGVEAGQSLYLWSDNGAILTVPEQGFSGELVPGGTVAAHEIADPRIANTGTYLRLQVVGMRSTEGGAYSVFTNDIASTRVWIATADGISSEDSIWIQEGSHQHFNVAFSKNGYYEVDFVVSSFRDINGNGVYDEGLDPYIESGLETIYYGVDIPGGPVDYVVSSDNRPVAFDDTYTLARGNVIRGNVLFNDADLDDDSLNAVVVAGVTKGTLTLNRNGSFTYTPGPSFDGSDSFTYRASDGVLLSEIKTVTITRSALPDFEAILTEGHADIGVALGDHDHAGGGGGGALEDPEWDLHVHDEETDTEYAPNEVLLYVGMNAVTTRPADAAYNFTGAAAGESLFVLPPSETPGLLFLGFGTEEIADGTLLGGSLTLRLKSASGPGHFSIWSSTLGGPNVAMATFDGITEADLLTLLENGHAHFNLGFTEMGMYQITFQAIGTLADGDVIISEDVTYFFKVGNTAEAIDVQNGMTQRSYIRNLDVLFGSEDGLDDILANPSRVRVTKFDLNGNNGSILPGTAFGLTSSGSRLKFDFGLQGLGGNRNTNAGDGYYRVAIDADGDGDFETHKHFYRLLGDVNGDGQVNNTDLTQTNSRMVKNSDPRFSLEYDVNGDGAVNALDKTLIQRQLTLPITKRKLKDDLFESLDD